jgi:hypothetical protein
LTLEFAQGRLFAAQRTRAQDDKIAGITLVICGLVTRQTTVGE